MAVKLARALGEDRDRLAARLHQAKHETQALAGALAMACPGTANAGPDHLATAGAREALVRPDRGATSRLST